MQNVAVTLTQITQQYFTFVIWVDNADLKGDKILFC